MTRIDFHSNVSDRIAYACRLTRKARAADCRIVVLAQDSAQLRELDEALWRFSDLDFLPHVDAGDPLAARTPIILTAQSNGRYGADWSVQWVGCEPIANGAACTLNAADESQVAALFTRR